MPGGQIDGLIVRISTQGSHRSLDVSCYTQQVACDQLLSPINGTVIISDNYNNNLRGDDYTSVVWVRFLITLQLSLV